MKLPDLSGIVEYVVDRFMWAWDNNYVLYAVIALVLFFIWWITR